ncbi:serine hydrolase domain-containing protein [Tautonia sociabilis]|uniref:Class A beta-lactamase-related serine hydrolase n=1 Tax=Tautonia sociabilis TaxID=2080755 RepID=A0A432MFZ8_9BACT|nr:serine hydrolase domain-containing protein [Tautonia sociabilis]RUL85362.1 class A beta-lactamase-related serine hydrolase [Tautonia sociabilis]
MPFSRVRLLVLGSALLATAPVRGVDIPAPPEFAEPRAFIEAQVAEGRSPSVAVAVVRDGEVVWAEGFGVANLEAGTAASADSIYWLASVSKPITATGLMVLVDRGLVDLDAPANRYLPGETLRAPLGSADAMTVRRLANHTSGLPLHYQFFYDGHRPPPMDETIRRYGFASKPPGSAWEYSNLGFGILGYITEVVSGTPWPEFMEREVFDPIGMTRTSNRVRPGLEADAAVPYTRDVGGRFVPVGHYDFDHPGASTIWSSANDLSRFALLHLNGGALDGVRLLSEEAARKMRELTGRRSPDSGTGIGWAVGTDIGRRVLSHSGGMPGVSTYVKLYPDDQAAVIVLRNGDGFDVTGAIADRITDALDLGPGEPPPPPDPTGQEAPDPTEGAPDDWIGSWAGLLADPDRGDLPVRLEVEAPDSARVAFGSEPPRRLVSLSVEGDRLVGHVVGTFRTQPYYHGPTTIEFHLDRRGDRLTGVARAFALGYFALPYWVDLSRQEDASGDDEPDGSDQPPPR